MPRRMAVACCMLTIATVLLVRAFFGSDLEKLVLVDNMSGSEGYTLSATHGFHWLEFYRSAQIPGAASADMPPNVIWQAPSFGIFYEKLHFVFYGVPHETACLNVSINSLLVSGGAIALSVLIVSFVIRLYRARKGRCVNCGYDLVSGGSTLCPECGLDASRAIPSKWG